MKWYECKGENMQRELCVKVKFSYMDLFGWMEFNVPELALIVWFTVMLPKSYVQYGHFFVCFNW